MRGQQLFAELYRKIEQRQPHYRRAVLEQNLLQGAQLLGALPRTLTHLAEQARASELRRAARNLQEGVVQAERQANEVWAPFSLFVVGMGKAGKSSLLNALIGAEVAPIDALPKTWKTDYYVAGGAARSATVSYRDGRTEGLTWEAAERLVAAEDQRRERSLDEIEELFDAYPNMPKGLPERQQLKAEIRRAHLYRSPVKEVRWHLGAQSLSGLMEHFVLVDTPGLAQDLGEERATLSDFYFRADGVVWVLDATTLSAKAPHLMLAELDDVLKSVGVAEETNRIAVLNHIDKVAKTGGTEAVSAVIAEANRLFGSRFLQIVPVCAKQALESVRRNDRSLAEESGLGALLMAIRHHFYGNAVVIQEQSKITGYRNSMQNLANGYRTFADRLREQEAKRIQLTTDLAKDLDRETETLSSRISFQLSEYETRARRKIGAEIESMLKSDNLQHRQQIVRNAMFEEARLREELRSFEVTARRQLTALQLHHAERSLFHTGQIYRPEKLADSFGTLISDRLSGLDQRFVALLGKVPDPGFWSKVMILIKFKDPQAELISFLEQMVAQLRTEITTAVRETSTRVGSTVGSVRESCFADLYGHAATVPTVLAVEGRLKELTRRAFRTPTIVDLIKGRDPHAVVNPTRQL